MSARDPKRVTASTYVVLVPDIRGSGEYRYVSDLRIDRTRTGKPALKSGEIVIRLRLHFDETALLSSIPTVDATVTGFTVAQPEPQQVEAGPVLDA